jgi:uncharacterized membrane protein
MEIVRRNRLVWGLGFLVLAAVLLVGVSLVVMSLWNWLGPTLFGWPLINPIQAAGLLILCRILFGNFLGRGGMHWRRSFAERWEQMSPEERKRFRTGMRGRCSRKAPDDMEATGPAP